eukprot:6990736-Pyramimonas_sp.AAC.1
MARPGWPKTGYNTGADRNRSVGWRSGSTVKTRGALHAPTSRSPPNRTRTSRREGKQEEGGTRAQ